LKEYTFFFASSASLRTLSLKGKRFGIPGSAFGFLAGRIELN